LMFLLLPQVLRCSLLQAPHADRQQLPLERLADDRSRLSPKVMAETFAMPTQQLSDSARVTEYDMPTLAAAAAAAAWRFPASQHASAPVSCKQASLQQPFL
jgi:hypothetical protein